MNLPEIFVQLLKVTVSLPNDYLKQRGKKSRNEFNCSHTQKYFILGVTNVKCIFIRKFEDYL